MERLLHIWTLQKSIKKETVSSRGGRGGQCHIPTSYHLESLLLGVQRQNWQLTLLRLCDEIFLNSITQYAAPRARSISREKVHSLPWLPCPSVNGFCCGFSRVPRHHSRREFRSTSEKKLLIATMIDWILTQRRALAVLTLNLLCANSSRAVLQMKKLFPRRVATIKCKSPAFVERNQSEALTSRKMEGKTVVRGMRASNCLICPTILNDWQTIESGEWTIHENKRKTICSTLLLAI